MSRPAVVAPDSFKGSFDAFEVAAAIARGLLAGGREAIELPVADGGEGTMDVLVDALGGELLTVEVSDPLGRPVTAAFVLLADDVTAVVETAQASGLGLVDEEERDALAASSRGTGELVAAAAEAGAQRVIVTVGGSATTDGGTGALEALEEADILRRRQVGGIDAWQLDHDYLARGILRIEADADRWRVMLARRAAEFADARGSLLARWRALLSTREQVAFLLARLRRRFRYGEHRWFAALSAAPYAAGLLVVGTALGIGYVAVGELAARTAWQAMPGGTAMWDCREIGGHAATATGGSRSLAAWKRCPKPVPNVPL